MNKALFFMHYVDELRQSRSDSDYFTLLCLKIIPLIRLLYQDSVNQWDQKIEAHKQIQRKAHQEGSNAPPYLLDELMEGYHAYDLSNIKEPWAAWDYFMHAEWAYTTNKQDFF